MRVNFQHLVGWESLSLLCSKSYGIAKHAQKLKHCCNTSLGTFYPLRDLKLLIIPDHINTEDSESSEGTEDGPSPSYCLWKKTNPEKSGGGTRALEQVECQVGLEQMHKEATIREQWK